MSDRRTICWWSTGAASAIMCLLTLRDTPDAIIARCETNNEDPDNYRFEADVMRRLNRAVTLLKSEEYDNVWQVWQIEIEQDDIVIIQLAQIEALFAQIG